MGYWLILTHMGTMILWNHISLSMIDILIENDFEARVVSGLILLFEPCAVARREFGMTIRYH